VLGVGMTFVIITSGIDLSIGSVLVFSSVVAAKVMEAVGGDGWGVASLGIVAALVAGTAWGVLNGFLIAKAKIPPLIVTLGSLSVALGLAQVMTGGIDIRSVPERADRLQHLHQDPRHSGAAVRRPDRGDPRRDRAAQDASSAATRTPSAPTSSARAGSASTSTGT
jgi:ribose/xylose/arabinose/galactoside ABC-type transport system permease subunit